MQFHDNAFYMIGIHMLNLTEVLEIELVLNKFDIDIVIPQYSATLTCNLLLTLTLSSPRQRRQQS